MGKSLYLECYSGISGDMTVAALLDLGADQAVLDSALKSLPVSGFQTKISRVVKGGIDACDFDVMLDKKHENHDHDMEYLHGHHHENTEADTHHHTHENGTDEMHMHSHTQEHTHAHDTESAHGHHHHEHRGLKEIAHMIEHSDMTENAKKTALRIFGILAAAEGKAHNVPADQVHFHEVGAIDSIVDIVGAAICIDYLNIDKIISSPVEVGYGTLKCAHGILPVPAPATAEILKDMPVISKNVPFEATTPTGAAIIKAMAREITYEKNFMVKKIGYGLGENESHICFEVDDFDQAYQLHKEMGCICFENKAMGIYFINDPDNYWIEILPANRG